MLRPAMDFALYGIIVFLFATWCTVHLLLCIEVAKRDFRRALLGFALFPLAPYFAYKLRIKKYPAFWITASLLYFLSLIAGSI